MIKIDSRTNLDDIRKVVSKIGKEAVEFDIIWLNFITRRKIVFLVSEILKKYNIEKYNDDTIYILKELITNAIKARYLHIIVIKSLRLSNPSYNQKIDEDKYFNDSEIMAQYSEAIKDKENKEKLKKLLNMEKTLINEMDETNNANVLKKEKYKELLDFRENTKKKFIIKLIIEIKKNNLEITVINDSPLIMINKTRIDSKRLTFGEYYNKGMTENFFMEQLDNSESAGFGLALCDLRLYNNNLNPKEHLKIYDENNKTYSKLILPIKQTFNYLSSHNKY
ncbi:hypothetical protein [Brachyspira catarrhinii]|uniref:ATP-binding protein n=1 Tax=Brachyspira catarrhinii TaxID=2528966 RepID=A0ABY2TQX5_9SPIR|nr:hypothetical protein [Brachyspira catarrhinii]TKZ34540.1 hypothetical protein EZH24_07690 [Brachyspira catarrhinii]